MSVRRLAAAQPASFAFNADFQPQVAFWLAKYPAHRKQSASIPLLWLAQKQEGWVSEPAIRAVAEMLEMPVIRVLEVATFYTMFQLKPVGTVAHVQVCGTTPCALRGAGDLLAVCKSRIGPKDTTGPDGRFSWEEVECMGACCNAPMAAINDYYYEDLTAETLGDILDGFASGNGPKPGSFAGRTSSEPAGGARTLLDETLYDGAAAGKLTLPNMAPAAETTPAG